tara:strand:- start:849 stop:1256 length:408 start_codon:yes stop_codon:yes gene_type:complete
MRLLGIDYGTARIGLAFTDTSLDLILPLGSINARIDDPFPIIKNIVSERIIDEIVVGLPLNKNSNDTEQSINTKSFIGKLGLILDKNIETVDESYSSVEAQGRMNEGLSINKSDGRLDSASACVILSRFLDRNPH